LLEKKHTETVKTTEPKGKKLLVPWVYSLYNVCTI